MRLNWWGLQGEGAWRRFGRLSKSEEISGIPGSQLYYHGVPFSMTEEFVAVYRMHPLIPDDYRIRSAADDRLIEEIDFTNVAGANTHKVLEDPRIDMADLFYSFGTSNPGAIVLHNFPNHLRHFTETDGTLIDLATVDIVRSQSAASRGTTSSVVNSTCNLRTGSKTSATMPRLSRNCAGSTVTRRQWTLWSGCTPRNHLRVSPSATPHSASHPHGVPSAKERPFLHIRLPARGVYPGGAALDREQYAVVGLAPALPEPGRCFGRVGQRLQAVAYGRDGLRRADVAPPPGLLELAPHLQVPPQ